MRYEFTIALEHVDGVLRIKPCGEFDRGAAKKLLELLRRQQVGEEPLIIDTTELGKVHTAACSLFKEGCASFPDGDAEGAVYRQQGPGHDL
ncbi:hypothetical protein [Desulfonatronum thioautotrophicum]|uniref:hypothetical protein n=1 Tax=Desulfonatronum thioautotrophicum TaxID=617001 RepID=UPI0005EBBB9D|nr:hypothetical protein [Desulfonatronum thioautotrophicum]